MSPGCVHNHPVAERYFAQLAPPLDERPLGRHNLQLARGLVVALHMPRAVNLVNAAHRAGHRIVDSGPSGQAQVDIRPLWRLGERREEVEFPAIVKSDN